MTIQLANDIQCVGCMACLGVCSQNCIKSVTDEEGFYYPAVDNSACINCGKCKEVCPALSDFDLSDYIKKSYYGKSKNKEVLKESTSGGIFYHLAESCLQSGGNVYGAFFDTDSMTLKCDSSDRVGLKNLMKSKYIESSMGRIIKEIKKDLINGRKVLFSGTPCEAAGIRKVFKNNENLIIVDFICHGVPSSKLFKEHLLKIKPRGALKEINFRPKSLGWDAIYLKIITEKNDKVIPYYLDSYYSGFMKYNILRKSCYKCKFRRYHVADITIADFWGYKKLNPDLDTKRGMSLIVVNTSKGEMYLNGLKENLDLNEMDNRFSDYAFSERNYDEAYKVREKFFALYKLKGFEKAAKKTYFNNIFVQKLKYKIKKFIGKE